MYDGFHRQLLPMLVRPFAKGKRGSKSMRAKPVEPFYDLNTEYEWQRLDRHRVEYALTLRAMET
jgi:hypothetical protein